MHLRFSQPPDARALRGFGLVLAAATAVLFGVVVPWRRGTWSQGGPFAGGPWSGPVVMLALAAAIAVLALLAPRTLGLLHRLWTKLGSVLAHVNSRVLMAILFVVAVVPIGIVLRLRGRDPMRRAWAPSADTYRSPSPPLDREHLERPY